MLLVDAGFHSDKDLYLASFGRNTHFTTKMTSVHADGLCSKLELLGLDQF